MKKTPLYEKHISAGGVMVDFAGYMLPVRYSDGIIAEHRAVRERAGLFDVSHMGEITLEGSGAEAFLEYLLTNRFSDMPAGKVRYSLMLYPSGGTVDDVLVYKRGADKFLIVVNAANREKDFEWIASAAERSGYREVKINDISDSVALLALQGKAAEKILAGAELPRKYYTFVEGGKVLGVDVLAVSRTGYTGEDGFEIFVSPENAGRLWDNILSVGAEYGAIPAGLGARDTLRLEAAMPLYGHELKAEYPASEAALDFAIKYDKANFIGKAALTERAPEYMRVGALVKGRGIVREGSVLIGEMGETIGEVTSGTMSPTLGTAVAMLRLKKAYGGRIFAEIRGKRIELELTPLPFYKRNK